MPRHDSEPRLQLTCPLRAFSHGLKERRVAMSVSDDRTRYRPSPSVLTALKGPRILTREVLAGLGVGLALIPEAIAFSIIAGVDPKVGLFSAFVMAVSIAFVGGRP